MFGKKKFPLMSTIVAAVLAISVAGEIKTDPGLKDRVFGQMLDAADQLVRSVDMLMGTSFAEESFTFYDGGVLTVAEPSVQTDAGAFSDAQPPADLPAQGAFYFPTAAPQAAVPLLVNAWNPLPEGYVPNDLVRMREYCGNDVLYVKGSEIEGCREAVDALMVMISAARAEGLDNWQVSAGYRSIAYQQQVMDNKVYEYRQQGLSGSEARRAAERYVAIPGCSEHHTGLAFDITVAGQSFSSTQQCKWLHEHCWDYGFILRYTEEKESVTGIAAEAWHFRYVGQPHAQIMRDNNWCLEEYIQMLG